MPARTPRRRITKVGSSPNPATTSNDVADVNMETTQVAERKVGHRYSPDLLPDHQGPYFAHEKAKLVQRDYRDVDGTLIAPHELYSKLTEGSLVLLTVSFATYLMANPGRKTRKVRKPFCFIALSNESIRYTTFLSIDSRSSTMEMVTLGIHPFQRSPNPLYSPATPKRRRDDAADAAFDSFGSKSSPSPAKKSRRTTTSTK
ncbi:hypothetical protein B0H14DRAFT_3636041 [Mycena olivaceomarginata]|nr:hypothetical protein B0H14DRAFT_3636041 [Mycena olivaceomarginata]